MLNKQIQSYNPSIYTLLFHNVQSVIHQHNCNVETMMANLLLPFLFAQLYPLLLSPSPHFLGVQGFILVALHSIVFFSRASHCVFRLEKGTWSDAHSDTQFLLHILHINCKPITMHTRFTTG